MMFVVAFFFPIVVGLVDQILRPSGPRFPQRHEIVSRLTQEGSRHLVIMTYGPDHDVHREWVYNRANIDQSDIVWAQDMGEAQNRELLNYYRDRKVWLLDPDKKPMVLKPYPGS